MDENDLTPPVDSSSSEPNPDFPFELPSEPKSNFLKISLVLFIAGLGVAVALAFGMKKISFGSFGSFSKDPKKIQAWLVESGNPQFALPADISFVGAYREVRGDKNGKLFVAGPNELAAVLPKQSKLAFELNAENKPLFFLMAFNNGEIRDSMFGQLDQQLQMQGKSMVLQNRIWVERKEVPLFIYETEKIGHSYQRLLMKSSDKNILLVMYLKDQADSVVQGLAGALKVDPKNISFVLPPPTAEELTQIILTGMPVERKKAVTDLIALEGPQPDAVTLLGKSLATSAPDVKADIISALGHLAKRNPEAISALVLSLEDKQTRPESMAALKFLGADAKESIPALKKIISNKKESAAIRQEAGKTLAVIMGRPIAAMPLAKKKMAGRNKKK